MEDLFRVWLAGVQAPRRRQADQAHVHALSNFAMPNAFRRILLDGVLSAGTALIWSI